MSRLQQPNDPEGVKPARRGIPGNLAFGASCDSGAVRPGSLISSDLGEPCAVSTPPSISTEIDLNLGLRVLQKLNVATPAPEGQGGDSLLDLNCVLSLDYREAAGFPSPELGRELRRIVDNFIKPYGQIWECWQDRHALNKLERVFNWGDVVVNAQPYTEGAGLSLWGFSTETKAQGRRKFVIFLNTAHQRAAVAATIGHELGHYVYGAIPGECGGHGEMKPMFAQHLADGQELFSDAVVALSAFSHSAARGIIGNTPSGSDPDRLPSQIIEALSAIEPNYRIDLAADGLSAAWRLRYLTLMIHFFKLRCALLDAVGI